METDRRKFLVSAGAALTTAMFTGDVKGANDRITWVYRPRDAGHEQPGQRAAGL